MSDDPYDPYDVNVYAKPNKNPIQKEIFEEEKDLGPDKPTGKMNKKTNVFNPYENKNATFTPIEDREESEENRPTLKRKKTDEELPENIDLTSSAYDPKKLAKKAREARKADAIGNNGDGIGDDIDEEDEPPLLEELGINPLNIKNKIISILMLQKIDKKSLEDSDMAGPFLVFMLFVFSLVLQKKFWFSYLYGISVFGSIMLFLLMNLMNKKEGILLYNTISVLGYCLIPVVLLSFISMFVFIKSLIGIILCMFVISLSSISATRFFEVALDMSAQKYLILYPVFLFYTSFVLVGNF